MSFRRQCRAKSWKGSCRLPWLLIGLKCAVLPGKGRWQGGGRTGGATGNAGGGRVREVFGLESVGGNWKGYEYGWKDKGDKGDGGDWKKDWSKSGGDDWKQARRSISNALKP